MLVPETTVNQWYSRKHWMFQQFSFLFQNPWWQKSVPSGFSVCPYFWASMLSFFALRPLIMLFTIVYNIILKPMGKPLVKFESWLTPKLNRLLKEKPGATHSPGFVTFFLTLLLVAGSTIGHLSLLLGAAIVTVCTVNPLLIPVFALLGVGVLMTILIVKYKLLNGELGAACKVNYYYLVWVLLMIGAIGVSNFGGPFGLIAAFWSNVVVVSVSTVWSLVVDGLTMTAGWIAGVVAFCWKMVVAFLSHKIAGIYWWLWGLGFFTGVTLLGNWMLKQAFLHNIESFTPVAPNDGLDTQQRRNRAAWRYVIWKGLTNDCMGWSDLVSKFKAELRTTLNTETDAGFDRPSQKYDGSLGWEHTTALSYNWYPWKASLLDTVFAPLLDQLQHRRCPAYFEWHATAVDFSDSLVASFVTEDVAKALNRQYGLGLNYIEQRKLVTVAGVVARQPHINEDYAEGLKSAKREIDIFAFAEKEAERKRANPRRSLLEVLFGSTERANELCASTTARIAAPFVAGGLLAVKCWQEFKTFLAWAKIYAKSKKQGACPYLQFKD